MRSPIIFLLSALALTAPVQAVEITQAQSLAATCANCHGTDGKSVGSAARLAGMPAQTLLQRIAEFKDGTRPATIMHQISKGYSDEQLRLIADYFAAQK